MVGTRGQTTQDFAFGMSLFLLAVLLLFGVVPTLLGPGPATTPGDSAAQADRVSLTILGAATQADGRVDPAQLPQYPNQTALQSATGLPPQTTANVTLQSLDGNETLYTTGQTPPPEVSTTERTRIVYTTDESCQSGCRLTVEVW